jgi:hypothetical protein
MSTSGFFQQEVPPSVAVYGVSKGLALGANLNLM